MSRREWSNTTDAVCKFCGRWAGEGGYSDSGGMWCEAHGRMRAVMAAEIEMFELLRAYPDDLRPTFEGVQHYRQGSPLHSDAVSAMALPPHPGYPISRLGL